MPPTLTRPTSASKIWFDLDNAPHVPFFTPIIRTLERKKHLTTITARDAFQVSELAEQNSLPHTTIGEHAGSNKFRKALGLLRRTAQLVRFARLEKPEIAISHGARSQIQAANLLKIPTIEFIDYEHVATPPLCRPRWEIVPEHYDTSAIRVPESRIKTYPGIKEDVYIPLLKPDKSILEDLNLDARRVLIVLRPPANEAHYHNAQADTLLEAILAKLLHHSNTQTVILPRGSKQESQIQNRFRKELEEKQFVIPGKAIDGQNLVYHADLVIGGGGTMTREAAALRTPSYSFFRGTLGAIDAYLEREKRLTIIRSLDEVETKLQIEKKAPHVTMNTSRGTTLESIIEHIESIIATERRKR